MNEQVVMAKIVLGLLERQEEIVFDRIEKNNVTKELEGYPEAYVNGKITLGELTLKFLEMGGTKSCPKLIEDEKLHKAILMAMNFVRDVLEEKGGEEEE